MAEDRVTPRVRGARSDRGRPWPLRAAGRVPRTGLAAAFVLAACGQPNPKIIEAAEPAIAAHPRVEAGLPAEAKIGRLIDAVRRSELTFVQDEIERTGTAAADKLQLLLERDIDGVRSAEEFIATIAAPPREEDADTVLIGPEQTMLAKEWYERQLAEIEGKTYQAGPEAAAAERARAERTGKRMRILDALIIVERSESTFIVPARRSLPAAKSSASEKKKRFKKRTPKAREYSGAEFADMLRKKWGFLGADIDELESFIKEIASDSFASLEPYRVRHADGASEKFEDWLRGQLNHKARQIAKGG